MGDEDHAWWARYELFTDVDLRRSLEDHDMIHYTTSRMYACDRAEIERLEKRIAAVKREMEVKMTSLTEARDQVKLLQRMIDLGSRTVATQTD